MTNAVRRGRKPRTSAERTAVSNKISQLAHEGYTNPAQRVAIAYSENAKGGVKRLRQSHGGRHGSRRRSTGGG